jgi:hypothetical protein
MVDAAGGRLDPARGTPKLTRPDPVIEVVNEWVGHYGDHRDGGIHYDGNDNGLWHAFDRLVPLQDPNRWTGFRKQAFDHLERHHGWRREGGSRSPKWWVPLPPTEPPPR